MTVTTQTMPRRLLTRAELTRLRADPEACVRRLTSDPALLEALLRQAEHAVDCEAVLDELEHFPAKPYGEAAALVAHITEACNELWNRYRYDEFDK